MNTAQLNQKPRSQLESSRNQQTDLDNLTRSDGLNGEEWHPDSGATNHITSNIQNLNLGNSTCTQNVHMGDGEAIRISYVGNESIKGKRQLYLNNLLRVPKIKKNLISVSQFANDNNAYIEFHPKFFLVRDLLSQDVLLQGKMDNGLYKFTSDKSRDRCDEEKWKRCIHNSYKYKCI